MKSVLISGLFFSQVLRVQLFHMKNLFKTCRLAKEYVFATSKSNVGLYTKCIYNVQTTLCVCVCSFCRVLDQFDTLPGHLTEDLHLFSLNDLSAVRSGDLVPRLKELLKHGSTHVAGCMVRQGFALSHCYIQNKQEETLLHVLIADCH